MNNISFKSLIKSQNPIAKAKKVKRIFLKAQIPANNATLTPPLGPLLGQFGVNIMEFCKDFNLKSLFVEKDILCKVFIYIEPNKTFSFKINLPEISYLFKLYLHNLFEQNQKLVLNNLLKFIYDFLLLKQIFYKLNYTTYEIKQQICCILGTFRSFHLFFEYK